MKTRTMLLLIALLCLMLILLAAGGDFMRRSVSRPEATKTPIAEAAPTEPAPTEAAAGKLPGNQVSIPIIGSGAAASDAPFSAPAWGEMPECKNQPLDINQLTSRAGGPIERQMALLAPGLSAQGLIAPAEGSAEVTALAMNVATGRLNRATEIQTSAAPGVSTLGALLDQIESAQGQPQQELIEAARQVQAGEAITRPVCARMVVTNAQNQPEQVLWAADGFSESSLRPQSAGQSLAASAETATRPPNVMDTGIASPNGGWAAFTSIGWDAGGPVFAQNFETGAWINLIEQMNRELTEGQLPEDAWWEVIGWFPDSQRILIGPADAASVYIVPLAGGPFQAIGLPTGGEGGGRVVGLAPDGSRIAYIGWGEGDMQSLTVYDVATGENRALISVPLNEGVLHYPRFSPDGSTIAFVQQKGHPLSGVTEAIWLISTETGSATKLLEGGLGLSVPTWSPDGALLAFTRKDADQPDVAAQGITPLPQRSNIWIASVPDGKLWQVTQVDGQARSPAWAPDGVTLGFVTHEGQVGMVNINRPGQAWLAADAAPQLPLYTSVFFVP